VGPTDYTFRTAADVIRATDLPSGLTALLSGHIHRHQVLKTDLRGRPLAAPVLYPGSIERTSFAEKDEPKGYLRVRIGTRGPVRGRLLGWSFHELPARPMVQLDLDGDDLREAGLQGLEPQAWLREKLSGLDPEGVVRFRVRGEVPSEWRGLLSAPSLRKLAPETMNVEVSFPDLSRIFHEDRQKERQ
jgi:DNA repair exonuclease SbcCD nuclease subunit